MKDRYTWLRILEAIIVVLTLIGLVFGSTYKIDAIASELRGTDSQMQGDISLLKQDFSTHEERDRFIQEDLEEIKADLKKLLSK